MEAVPRDGFHDGRVRIVSNRVNRIRPSAVNRQGVGVAGHDTGARGGGATGQRAARANVTGTAFVLSATMTAPQPVARSGIDGPR